MDESPQRKPCDGRKVKHPSLDRASRHAAGLAHYNAPQGPQGPSGMPIDRLLVPILFGLARRT